MDKSQGKLKYYFNLPNCMGYYRIIMLPVFMILYVNADSVKDYVIALVILAISYITDFFDGKIARKFNMVTEWGKMIDPFADKLTQGVLALTLVIKHPELLWFLILFCAKELYMVIMGLYIGRIRKQFISAKLYGKGLTLALDILLPVLLVFPNLPKTAVYSIIGFLVYLTIVIWIHYLFLHLRILRDIKNGTLKDKY